ncbi:MULTISPECIES: hypothetical protein [Nocardiaceae]|uniref:Na+/H+-dicarboxylate symporter n=1 Tax=Rhodococcoides corynebacterioides TaxID=53972 RepID=A0ABS2KY21_9NOCA|nr:MULTISPECIES: hypothetical protein [Rhodococcus]MBM7416834.1 Na+/H+-dicarboxylate symporter [Rhodococcus corynebacterioides]MBP1115087.1 Na+/H+-dicarboxylate symporter [Rhodococcus sp. PvP016]
MSALAAVVMLILLWAAMAALFAALYGLWVVLVLDPLWIWQERRRREADAIKRHQRALADIDEQANLVVHRLAERYDAARNEIRRQGRQQ